MLFIWLLTLGAGIANACLLHEDHAEGSHVGVWTAYHTQGGDGGAGATVAVQAVVTVFVDADHGQQSLQSIACRTLCAAEQMAVPKQKIGLCADFHADAVLVVTCGPVSVPADPMPRLWRIADAPRPEPPVFIRFLRLTL